MERTNLIDAYYHNCPTADVVALAIVNGKTRIKKVSIKAHARTLLDVYPSCFIPLNLIEVSSYPGNTEMSLVIPYG